ncbi:hypothetical protein IHE45_17G053000 [Dioscorea alata]|uniref:Uncharacterized protein n=2 Tax=Dioscorea alata TaxID=55571 RepID=A0ACB7UCH0_DIOAL|nr:hypothetical protein IHE45_17G053000 [Dioscorea alata]KAH7657937.1 hypothetical protein IHE45_17G053000 [Dioscorea alata]
MVRGSKNVCRSASHQLFKDKAKNRVDDLQGMFTDLQLARKESRTGDVVVLEEQVHQMLREWKAELTDDSPASSLLGNAQVSSDLSSEIRRLLQLYEEEDDATSKLAELPPVNPKPEPLDVPEPDVQSLQDERIAPTFQQDYYVAQGIPEHGLLGVDQYKCAMPTGLHHGAMLEEATHLDYQQFHLHQESSHNYLIGFDTSGQSGREASHITEVIQAICPPPSAFVNPKCALWDCQRPALGSEWCHDYCSNFHATLALNEGPPGRTPVLRPGGIDLKDGPLFAALCAKTHGKNVGIPECEGAATAKSPWNARELFDLSILEGESLREWLFFDKPRRAFESGNRKQRSLPDYNGRGWHESRKQVMKDYGGLKRSYYMDPQPHSHIEWHLYEYEINNYDSYALYRLELKLVDPNKSTKGKVVNDSLADLQQQMGRLNAENPMDNKRSVKGRTKVNQKASAENVYTAPDITNEDNARNVYPADQMATMNGNVCYGPQMPYDFNVDSLNDLYRM